MKPSRESGAFGIRHFVNMCAFTGLLMVLPLMGCGGDAATPSTDTSPDTVQDTSPDAALDTAEDTAQDSIQDSAMDTTPDVGPDVDLSQIDPVASSVFTSGESKPADGLTDFEIVVTVVDGAGQPIQGASITLETDGSPGLIIYQPLATDDLGTTTGRVLAIDGGTYAVAARVGQGDDSVLLAQEASLTFTGCTTTPDYYRRGVRGPVFSICTGCHNEYGLAIEEPWKSLSMWHIDDRIDDGTVANTLATLSPLASKTTPIGNDETMPALLAKPQGLGGHVGGKLIQAGSPAHANLTAFVSRLNNGDTCAEPATDIFDGVTLLSDKDTLHKAALMLTGREPTASEAQMLANSGDLEQVIEEYLLTSSRFSIRLQDLYNDVLLTDRYLGYFKLIAHLAEADFSNRFYFRKYNDALPQYNNATYTCGSPGNGEPCCEDVDPYKDLECPDSGVMVPFCRHADAYAVQNLRRQSLALIAHVVKNDKPFTEILTANYVMVNPALARIFGVLDTPDGVSFDDHCDLEDWKPVKLEMAVQQGVTEENAYPSGLIPHAGIFSTHTFMNRYTTTTTNLNRHRAASVMKKFLDIDIEKLLAFTVEAGGEQTLNATKDDPVCRVCHAAMDPVAGAFHKWTGIGRVRRGRVWHVCTQYLEKNCIDDSDCVQDGICVDEVCVAPGYEAYLCVRPIGYKGEQVEAPADRAPLRWMTAKMAQDPRFASATVKTMLTLLTGREVLTAPADPADPSYAAQMRAYIAQEAEVARVTTLFVGNDYDLKTAIAALVIGQWFRAANGNVSGAAEAALLAGQVGGGRLLTPEELALRIRDVTGFPWITLGGRQDSLLSTTKGYLTIYGGIDSKAITQRMRDPFAVASAVSRRMANEMGCVAVPQDFAWTNPLDRKYFALIDPTANTLDGNGVPSNIGDIEETIELLHAAFLNEAAPAGSEAHQETYDLLLAVWQGGLQRVTDGTEPAALPSRCQATQDLLEYKSFANSSNPNRIPIVTDPNYVIRAWMAVANYLLSDARFLLN